MSLLRSIGAIFGFNAASSPPESPIPKLETMIELRFTVSHGDSSKVADIGPDHVTTGAGPFYVYFHRDVNGKIFYVGKGTGRRAYSKDRDAQWHKYVQERSARTHTVQIVSRHLTSEEAEDVEGSYISLYGAHLTNWINTGRQTDYAACDRYWKARKANDSLMAEARPLEATDSEAAIAKYRQAMRAMYEYESIVMEVGLIPDLMGPNKFKGDAHILDRLTLCLFKHRRYDELDLAVTGFLNQFPGCHRSTILTAVLKRHARAQALRGAQPPKP